MGDILFLLILGFIWISFASIQDLKKREVANWISFSLIIFAIVYRFFYYLFMDDFNFLFQGLIGLGIFFILGNLFYYSRMFAGGDAKLMIALGAILPFSNEFFINLKIFLFFILVFLVVGGIYGLIISFVLGIKNFKKFRREFIKRLKKDKKRIYFVMVLGLLLMVIGFKFNLLFILGIIVFVFSYFYLYAKSVDEVCMVKKVSVDDLTEGDWIYKDVKIGKKLIRAKWDGLSKREIRLIRKNKKHILIRYGIPFVPVFWFSFLILVFVWFSERFSFGLF